MEVESALLYTYLSFNWNVVVDIIVNLLDCLHSFWVEGEAEKVPGHVLVVGDLIENERLLHAGDHDVIWFKVFYLRVYDVKFALS